MTRGPAGPTLTMIDRVDLRNTRTFAMVATAVAGLALIFRAVAYLVPGSLLAERDYDDGVMFGAAIAFLQGQMPYADFIYLHPPGSFLVLVPAALLEPFATDAQALAVARIGAILIGSANTALICALLRRYGLIAVAVGGVLYAVWPAVVQTERTVFLEPVLNLALLAALVCFSTRRRWAPALAGVGLGIALVSKYWAVVDVVVVGIAVAAVFGLAGLWRFLAGVAAASLMIALPFYLRDPSAMWGQTVAAQLGRPRAATTIGEKGSMFSPLTNVRNIDERVPDLVWILVVVALVAVAVLPVVRGIRRRVTPARWDDPTWWGLIVVAHAVVLALGSSFYFHYTAWLLAPLSLSLGAATTGIRRTLWRRIIVITLVGLVVVAAVGEARRLAEPTSTEVTVRDWARDHSCIWTYASVLIVADHLTNNLASGCDVDLDSFGAALTELRDGFEGSDALEDNALWRARAWDQIGSADGVVLPIDDSTWWLDGSQRTAFVADFEPAAETDTVGLWSRREG